MPRRLQQKRSKGWKKPAGAVVVSRPSKWGNPFRMADGFSHAEVVAEYRRWIAADGPRQRKIKSELDELRGKDLLCWCREGTPCHGDVLLEMANPPRRRTKTASAGKG